MVARDTAAGGGHAGVPVPIVLWLGEELRLIYNDAYIPVLGDKHPAALGRAGTRSGGISGTRSARCWAAYCAPG